MKPKTKRILTWIALVFVGIFTVSFTMFLYDLPVRRLFGIITGVIAVTSFIIGGGLAGFVIIMHKRELRAEESQKAVEEDLKENVEE